VSLESVLTFWFEELQPPDWFQKNDELDRRIDEKFSSLLDEAARCELWHWRTSPEGRLAEIIVLDQFSRNIHRGTPLSFATDPLSLCLAQEAVSQGADTALEGARLAFLYMPYMHSESALVHEQAVSLFALPGLERNLEYEHKHKAIIDRFGRYPHRNEILGRESTPEELAFLEEPGSSF
jgi:uncharacterized protein (DUF924 family)